MRYDFVMKKSLGIFNKAVGTWSKRVENIVSFGFTERAFVRDVHCLHLLVESFRSICDEHVVSCYFNESAVRMTKEFKFLYFSRSRVSCENVVSICLGRVHPGATRYETFGRLFGCIFLHCTKYSVPILEPGRRFQLV